jgi:phosphatidylglycerophosphate synthase
MWKKITLITPVKDNYNMSASKIPSKLENPFDNVLVSLAESASPLFRELNLTPNMLTSLCVFFLLVSVYLLIRGSLLGFAICYVLSYWFDVTDGYFARKYRMETNFGDNYDHLTDILGFLLLIIVSVCLYRKAFTPEKLIFTTILLMLSFVQFGCQERWSEYHSSSKSLACLKQVCPAESKSQLENVMGITRYFGSATLVTYMVILVCVLEYQTHK